MRVSLGLRVGGSLALLLAMACTRSDGPVPEQAPPAPPSEEPTPAAAPPSSAPAPEPLPDLSGPSIRLRWQLDAGDSWEEEMSDRMFVLEHPKDAFDPTVPISTTTQTERFEVVEASANNGVRLRTTIEDLQLEIRAGGKESVYRSSDPPSASMDRLAAQRLAFVGVPLEVTLSALGSVERVHGIHVREAEVLGHFDALAASLSEDDRGFERSQLTKEFAQLESTLRERGVRPPLPEQEIRKGSRWTHTMTLPSLMNSTVGYGLTYTIESIDDDEVSIEVKGTGALAPSPMMATILESSEFRIEGTVRIDARRGVLLEEEETLQMTVVLRDNPMIGQGGTMASRIERRRVRRDETASTTTPQ